MLEPITPSHIPEKIPQSKDENPLGEAAKAGDGEGYRFNLFSRFKKPKQITKPDERDKLIVYNDVEAVQLTLSPEAHIEIEKQRRLKEIHKNSQDE
jgi:hypothetical protein